MNDFKDTVLKGLYWEYLGKRQQVYAELNVLLDNSVGVGDHAVQAKDVADKIKALEEINSFIDTVVEEFEEIITDAEPLLPEPDQSKCKAGGTPPPEPMLEADIAYAPQVKEDCCDDGKCEC